MKAFNLKDLLVFLSSILSALLVTFIVLTTHEENLSNRVIETNQVVIQQASVNTISYKDESLTEIIHSIQNTVVDITASSLHASSAGSGVIIGKDANYSYIITNHHVIDQANTFTVELYSGESYPATLVGSDPENDIAVIKIEAPDLTSATFIQDSDTLQVGDTAIAIGNPLGTLGGTVSKGIISALDRELEINGEQMVLMQTDAAVNSGNSSGGLFNANGLLIGIVNAKAAASGVEGLAFAIPSNVARDIATELIRTATSEQFGYIEGRTTIGATFVDGYYSTNWFERQAITYVYALDSFGSAYKSGLRVEDILVSVTKNNEKVTITKANDIEQLIKDSQVGDELILTVKRGGINANSLDIKVKVDQYIYKF